MSVMKLFPLLIMSWYIPCDCDTVSTLACLPEVLSEWSILCSLILLHGSYVANNANFVFSFLVQTIYSKMMDVNLAD